MYLKHFGFNVAPFELAPNADFLYLSKGHKKALTYLNYALWNKDAFTLLTGDIGSGKTILLQHLLKTMPSAAQILTLYQTQLSPYELLYVIAEKLGLVTTEQPPKPKLFELINQYLLTSEKNVVLVIDEAQSFSRETLEELRLLAGMDMTTARTSINIILCGQPELKDIVENGELEQLNQRIKLRFHLNPLDYDDTKKYILYRTAGAGQRHEVFTQDAIKRMYELTGGLPRLINMLADTALTCCYADGLYAVSSKEINEAAEELGWDTTKNRSAGEEKKDRQKNTGDQGSKVVELPRSGEADTKPSLDMEKFEGALERIEYHLEDIAASLRKLASVDSTDNKQKMS